MSVASLCALDNPISMDKLLLADRCQRSLATFTKTFWPVIEPVTRLRWGFHTQAITEHLEAVTRREIRRLVICVPPGHMKSTLTSVMWPSWEWIDNPNEQSLFGSYD